MYILHDLNDYRNAVVNMTIITLRGAT